MVDIETFRNLALSFPGTSEQPHFELTSFRANKKIFATLDTGRNRVCLMLSEIDQSVFCSNDKRVIYPVPNKWGQKGATYMELNLVNKTILKDALSQAYLKSCSKKKTIKYFCFSILMTAVNY